MPDTVTNLADTDHANPNEGRSYLVWQCKRSFDDSKVTVGMAADFRKFLKPKHFRQNAADFAKLACSVLPIPTAK